MTVKQSSDVLSHGVDTGTTNDDRWRDVVRKKHWHKSCDLPAAGDCRQEGPMKRIMWAVVTATALAAPAFAQSPATTPTKQSPATAPTNQGPATAPTQSSADVQRDQDKVKHDRAALKADQAAGKTADVTNDRAQLKKDRAQLRADMKAAGITPKHHTKTTNDAQGNTTNSK
jgi:hypothetical protein